MAQLNIRSLHKSYGNLSVLENIDIEARDGEFVVLLGPSGCGKSTLLGAIAGLEPISSGDILIDGRSVARLEPKDRDIAMVFQSYALYPTMTVRDNIAFGMKVRGVAKPERDKAIARVAETLQIGALLDRKPGQLSGGQRQRVAMGRALVRSPKVFLFDEPLSNLDAKLRVEMRAEIKKLYQRLSATIVYVTHDQIEAMTLATKIVVMKSGVIQQVGSPDEIYGRPANTYVAGFIGSPPMNLIPARMRRKDGRVLLEIEGASDKPLHLAISGPANASVAPEGTVVIAGIRPEAIFLPHEKNHEHTQKVDAVVDLVEPTGSDTFVTLNLGGNKVIARCHPKSALRAGRETFLVDIDGIQIFDVNTGMRIEQAGEDLGMPPIDVTRFASG
ncbi:sn-glycerol-3-phosphate ABC transporter ATP-binding protein UgpC [Mesorhizobium sp. M0833]|uniref:ABC transporter ATP-binding protein n=1 Tax=Mesorhizobium sp. M0833 TaxID=2957009 RepID=UPI00333BCF7E